MKCKCSSPKACWDRRSEATRTPFRGFFWFGRPRRDKEARTFVRQAPGSQKPKVPRTLASLLRAVDEDRGGKQFLGQSQENPRKAWFYGIQTVRDQLP